MSGESTTVAPKGAKGDQGRLGLQELPGIDGSRVPGGPPGQLLVVTLCILFTSDRFVHRLSTGLCMIMICIMGKFEQFGM